MSLATDLTAVINAHNAFVTQWTTSSTAFGAAIIPLAQAYDAAVATAIANNPTLGINLVNLTAQIQASSVKDLGKVKLKINNTVYQDP